jgi:hypothetical protein
MNPPPLYFLHISKTGGTSLSSVLRRAYPMHRSLTEGLLKYVADETMLRSYDYIDGHLAWLPDHLLQPGTLRCTVLRDPIARTISHMFMFQRQVMANMPNSRNFEEKEKEALRRGDFLQILQSKQFCTRYDNMQCKSLSRVMTGQPIYFSTSLKIPPANESDFIAAQQHLQAINFVGLTERLDDTARMIGAAIGLSVKTTPRKNVALHPPLFDASQQQEILQIIEDLNRYDIELYRMAQERFKAQWEAYAHLPPVRMTNRVRFHSATWSAYALLQRCYQGVFKNAARGRLRLLHRIHSFVGARKTSRT